MKLALTTPVLTLNPRVHNSWEETASFDAVVAIAETADRLGYHHITCSEHVAVPAGDIAAQLDAISGGRLILGVGVGSLEEEFALLGAPFADRGVRGDESLRELRRILGRREVDGFVVDPCAVQEHVPIWIGGRTRRSLRRAVELADGWAPFRLTAPEIAEMLDRAPVRPDGFEVVLFPEPMPDPVGEPDRTQDIVQPYIDAGATILNLRMRSESLAHCLEQIEAAVALLG